MGRVTGAFLPKPHPVVAARQGADDDLQDQPQASQFSDACQVIN
jgi:hypothetical protein